MGIDFLLVLGFDDEDNLDWDKVESVISFLWQDKLGLCVY
jgi:hypothetical protein